METVFKKEIIEKISDEVEHIKVTSEEFRQILKAGIITLYPQGASLLENEEIDDFIWSHDPDENTCYKIYLKEK